MTEILQCHTLAPRQMTRVILESPYAGDVAGNVDYARSCIADSLARGEAPIASHLLFTQPGILNDDNPIQRAHGINAGHAWLHGDLHKMVVYVDRGISGGMRAGINIAMHLNVPIEYRKLDGGVVDVASLD